MTFSITCWIFDEDPQTVFDVEIHDEDKDIKFLKTEIKRVSASRLGDVFPSDLELWQVDIPSEELREWLPKNPPLKAFQKLGIFKNGGQDHVHVIINNPVKVLNCFIIGDDSIFVVEVPKTKTVNFLKDLIMAKKPSVVKDGDGDASHLNLWEVTVPTANFFFFTEPPTETPLANTTPLSELFLPVVQRGFLHVVVQVVPRQAPGQAPEHGMRTPRTMNETYRRTCSEILGASTPSNSAKSNAYPTSQKAYSINDGRYKADAPRTRVAPPIQLFHPAFGNFLNDISHADGIVPDDVILATTQYMQATSAYYDSEELRRLALIPLLREVLGFNIQQIENRDKTKSDGVVEGIKNGQVFLLLVKEDKNEFGDGGSDPSTQVGLSAARAWVDRRFQSFRDATACPTFLLATAGAWFAVLGFAFTDRVIIQRLTDFIWAGIDSPLSRSHVNRVASIFHALRNGLATLNSYYMDLKHDSVQPAPTRYFPSITTYTDKHGHDVKFKYVAYLEHGSDCVTLRAQTETEPPQDIVVKFVERYSERAHRMLAGQGLAPQLEYYGPLQPYGSPYLVVMAYIHGHTFALAKSKMNEGMVGIVKSEIKRALTLLHDHGLVFGDLRPPNVMITKEITVKLIDFDWAGEAGQVKYPHLLSPAVTWPKGARPLDPISIEHDLEMLEGL